MLREISGALKRLPRRSWISFILVFALIFVFFLWHLGNLTPGMSKAEISYAQNSQSWSNIVSHPLNAPHRLFQLATFKLAPGHPSLFRLASVGFALVFCLAYYKMTRIWFGRVVGLLATLIFASLPLFVISARQAFPAILFFAPIVFISTYNWLLRSNGQRDWVWLIACAAAAVFLFTPGLPVWLAAAFIICRKQLSKTISGLSAWSLAGGSAMVALSLSAISWAAARDHQVIKNVLLVPAHAPDWLAALKDAGWMVFSLFAKTGHADRLLVGRLPILNILLMALLVFGVYAMLGASRAKTIALGSGVIYAIVMAGLNNDIELLALGLPSVAIFIAAGLRYLYIEWRSVFPRNPVPRTFAVVLITFVAATQVYFGLRYSLSAWPNTPATRSSYVLK